MAPNDDLTTIMPADDNMRKIEELAKLYTEARAANEASLVRIFKSVLDKKEQPTNDEIRKIMNENEEELHKIRNKEIENVRLMVSSIRSHTDYKKFINYEPKPFSPKVKALYDILGPNILNEVLLNE